MRLKIYKSQVYIFIGPHFFQCSLVTFEYGTRLPTRHWFHNKSNAAFYLSIFFFWNYAPFFYESPKTLRVKKNFLFYLNFCWLGSTAGWRRTRCCRGVGQRRWTPERSDHTITERELERARRRSAIGRRLARRRASARRVVARETPVRNAGHGDEARYLARVVNCPSQLFSLFSFTARTFPRVRLFVQRFPHTVAAVLARGKLFVRLRETESERWSLPREQFVESFVTSRWELAEKRSWCSWSASHFTRVSKLWFSLKNRKTLKIKRKRYHT